MYIFEKDIFINTDTTPILPFYFNFYYTKTCRSAKMKFEFFFYTVLKVSNTSYDKQKKACFLNPNSVSELTYRQKNFLNSRKLD